MHNDVSLICINQKISESNFENLTTWNTVPKLVIEHSFEILNLIDAEL
jgi:hypothetical protein